MNSKRICLLLALLLAFILTACGALAPTPISPTASTQSFWAAINAQKIDEAMAFVADDVQLSGGPFSSLSHKVEFSAIMSSQTKDGVRYEISELKVGPEDTVIFNLKVYDNLMVFANGQGKFKVDRDGKFVLMEFPN